VLVLHGGAEEDPGPVTWGHKPWLRARLLGLQVGPALRRAGLDVWLLRYREIGWNAGSAATPAPVQDARWALDRVRDRHPDPDRVLLLGHSMGARTSLAVADDPLVRGVVGLAPWFPLGEAVEPIAGKRLVAAHGRADTVTKYTETEALVRRATGVAASAELVDMGDLGHTMMDGLGRWNALVREHVLAAFA
jgi:predicted esterase